MGDGISDILSLGRRLREGSCLCKSSAQEGGGEGDDNVPMRELSQS